MTPEELTHENIEYIALFEHEINAVTHLKKIMKKRGVGIEVYCARPNKGVGANRSVSLYKWRDQNGWIQGKKFWGGNHRERCDAAIAELRQFSLTLKEQGTQKCHLKKS